MSRYFDRTVFDLSTEVDNLSLSRDWRKESPSRQVLDYRYLRLCCFSFYCSFDVKLREEACIFFYVFYTFYFEGLNRVTLSSL